MRISKMLSMALLVLTSLQLWQHIECISLFDNSNSYAIFDIWNITSVGKLELKFKTQTQYSLLLYIDDVSFKLKPESSSLTTRRKSKHFIEASLIKGELQVTQKVMSNTYKKTVTLGKELNDLKWHRLKLTRFIGGPLQIEIDSIVEVITFPKHIEALFQINSRLFVGGLSRMKQNTADITAVLKPRFVGCVEDLKYSSGSLVTKPVNSVYKGESIELRCSAKCSVNPCLNEGKCVNLFTKSRCDCFGTGYEGEICKQPTETISLSKADYITWNLPVSPNLKTSLKFRMKSATGSGLIFYSKRHGETLVVELIKGRLRVSNKRPNEVAKETVSRTKLFDAEWHIVSLQKRVDAIEISIDDREYLKLDGTSNGLDGNIRMEKPVLYFGGLSKPKFRYGVKSGANYQGCLQHIEYNNQDIIYKMKNTINKQIIVHGQLKYSCQYNKSNIILPTTTPAPTTRKIIQPNIYENNKNKYIENNIPFREVHTRDNTIGTSVIVWITAAIVIGTILIMGSAACVVHHIRIKYKRKTRKAKLELASKDNDAPPNQDQIPLQSIRSPKKNNEVVIEEDAEIESESTTPTKQPMLSNNSTD